MKTGRAKRFQRFLPALAWRRHVTRTSLRADLTAGLISAVIVLPQAIAFATLAGLPPEYGLYAAMIPAAIAALFGSSWHAVTGPTNAVSLFVFATLSPLAEPGSAEYIRLALTLSVMAGLMMLAMGMLGLGRLVNFISHTVVVGFTAGAGTLIITSQLRNVFGLDIPAGSAFLTTLHAVGAQIGNTQPYVLMVGTFTLAAGLVARRTVQRVPYMIVALVAGSLLASVLNAWLGADHTGIATLGALPGAFPPLSRPDFSPDTLKSLMGVAFGITVLGLTEAISIARGIALKSGQRIDSNQEFIGQGLANIAAGFFSGYPAAASFNRSGANYEAGARTPLAAASSALFLVLVLAVIGPLVSFIPVAAMAAVLFLVAWGLFDFHAMRTIARTSRSEAGVLAFTFAATLLMNLEVAILVGVTLSLLVYLNRTSRPQMRSLTPDPQQERRVLSPVADGLKECPQIKIMSVEGSMYFGAVDHVASHLDTLREVAPGQKHLLLIMRSVNFVDVAGAETLAAEARRRRDLGGSLCLYRVRQPVKNTLRNSGLIQGISESAIFDSNRDAIAALVGKVDRSICAGCTARIFLECRTLPEPAAAPNR